MMSEAVDIFDDPPQSRQLTSPQEYFPGLTEINDRLQRLIDRVEMISLRTRDLLDRMDVPSDFPYDQEQRSSPHHE